MRYSKAGFALIIVLLFLEIFSILSLYALENIVLEKRLADQFWRKHLMVMDAQTLLETLEKQISDNTSCLIPVSGVLELLAQTMPWWREVSCAGNFHLLQYYYVIEDLSRNTCSYIEQVEEGSVKKVRAGYFRLTLYLVNPLSVKERVMLQSVVVVPVKVDEPCNGDMNLTIHGRKSWRELI